MPTNRKGDRRERELVNKLDDAGFAVIRAPASGGATQRELPDVLAGNGDAFYAIEAKSSSGNPIYLTGEEVQALVYFAQNFGANPRIGVRFDHEDWYFFHPGDCYTTDGGNYRVKKEIAVADGTDLAELAGDTRKVTLQEATERGHANPDGGDGDGDGDGDDGVRKLLQAVADGTLGVEEAADALS